MFNEYQVFYAPNAPQGKRFNNQSTGAIPEALITFDADVKAQAVVFTEVEGSVKVDVYMSLSEGWNAYFKAGLKGAKVHFERLG